MQINKYHQTGRLDKGILADSDSEDQKQMRMIDLKLDRKNSPLALIYGGYATNDKKARDEETPQVVMGKSKMRLWQILSDCENSLQEVFSSTFYTHER